MLNGDQRSAAAPSPGGPSGPGGEDGGARSRRSRPANLSRRLLLFGAGAAALGGGGLAASLMTKGGSPPPARLSLATGPKGAVYLQVGGDLARAVQAFSPSTTLEIRSTAATVENLRLLTKGSVDLGFASLDAAVQDAQVRQGVITGLSRVYDSCLHLIVLDDSPIQTMRDLRGKRVSVGGSGSGTEFTARLLLSTVGVVPGQVLTLGQTPSMTSLDNGTIDAAFSLTGFPTPAIAELANRRPLRLISLGEYFGDLERTIPHAYAPAPIPNGTYQGVPSVDTLLVPNVLLARPGLPAAAVTLLMSAMFAEDSQKFWVTPDSKRISQAMATITGGVTLHPAAKSWLDAHHS